jgi:hypothetical protein
VPEAGDLSSSTDSSEPTWSEIFDDTLQMWVGKSTSGRTISTWWWVNTDPLDADSDGDAMPDGWEYENWLHPKKASDSTADPDTDGLTNLAECLEGTDPWIQDTDEDALSDGHEVNVSLTDPLDPADPGVAAGSETAGSGGGNTIVSRFQSFGGGGSSVTTQAQLVSGLALRSQQPPFSKNLQPGKAPQKQSNQPTQDDELYLETRLISLGYGPTYDGPLVEDDNGAIDGYWEETFDAETGEIIRVWIQTGGGGGSIQQNDADPKFSGSVSWKANGQFQVEESNDHDNDAAAKAFLLAQTIPSDTDWDADSALSYRSGASTGFTSHEFEEGGRTIRSGSGYRIEARLVRKDGSGSNANYLTVEKDVEKTFLKIVKSRPSPYNQSDKWTIESGTEVVTLKITAGDSMSVEDGETPVDVALLKPEIRDGRITSVSLLPLEFITSNSDQGGIEISDGTVSLTDATPVVEMEVADAQLDGNGQLTVMVEGRMKDRLSEAFEDGGSRLQNLNFSVNGESESDTRNFQYAGNGTPPFSFTNSETDFTKTFTVPDAQPGTYVFKAETGENAAGNTGWDKVAVTLYLDSEFTSAQNNGTQVSITFDNEPSDTSTDAAQIYYGNSPPTSGATTVTESGAATNQFTGTLGIDGETANCIIELGTITTDAQTRNRMSGTVRWTLADGTTDEFSTIFLETANQSLQFTPDPTSIQVGEKKLVIGEALDLPGSQRRAFEPLGLRIPFGDDFDGKDVTIKVNGEDHKIKNLTYDGESSWYVVKSESAEHAKVFLPSVKPLPSAHSVQGIGNDTEDSKIEWSMQLAGQGAETKISDTFLMAERSEDDLEEGHPADGPSDYWKPGDTITREHLFTAYKFIYPDELSQILLQALLEDEADDNGELRLEDVYNNYSFNPLGFGGNYIIKIEHDDSDVHPGIAAAYLHQGLRRALGEITFKSRAQELAESKGIDVSQVDVLNAWREQLGPIAAQTGLVAAECYLAGIGIVNEGGDWALVINDVSEGHYTSLAAILPFIPRGLVKAGETGLRVRNRAGDVLEDLSDVAKIDAVKELYRTRDLRVMGTLMDDAQMSASLRKAFSSNGGPIPLPPYREQLRERMLKIGVAPEWGKIERGTQGRKYSVAIAHHDFPWAEHRWFARHGLDANDPAFGRWVSTENHDRWHSGAGGGTFNQFWKNFIDLEDPLNPYTVGEILDRLAECRREFPVNLGYVN